MVRGKQTCKILKEIRRQIAEANDIEFVTSECRYKGDCFGTCPKCEAEVRYLEQQLRVRSLAGKAVALAGISAGIMLMSGCNGKSSNLSNETLQGEPVTPIEQTEVMDSIDEESEQPEDTMSASLDLSVIKEGEIAKVPIPGEVPDYHPADPDEKGVYSCVERMPEFPGGNVEMLRFINQHLKYPEEQLKEGFQGRVVVKFYVDTLGRVCEPEILRSKDSALDREALRVVRLFPDFTPGTLNGKKVNTYMALPITFKLPAD